MIEASRTRKLYAVAAAALLIFIWLAHAAPSGETLAFDLAVRNAIHGWASSPLTIAMRVVTDTGEPVTLIVIAIVFGGWFSLRGQLRLAVVLAVSTIGAVAACQGLEVICRRPRPLAFFGYTEPMTYSFPSGHATTSICFYGLLAILVCGATRSVARRRAIWAAAAVLILLIGFSRVYLGVHYPADVLGGYTLGIVWLLGVVPATAGRWLRPS